MSRENQTQQMSKSRTTRQVSDEHENFLVKRFADWNARRSPSSGAMPNDPIDVTSDLHVIEAKATEGKSISVKLDDWLKNRAKAYNGRRPAMAFRFRDPYNGKHIDLFLVEVEDYMEKIENDIVEEASSEDLCCKQGNGVCRCSK